jgi:hypothetical protein
MSRLDREPPNANLSKGCWGFFPTFPPPCPPGESVTCVGVVAGNQGCVWVRGVEVRRVGFDAVYEKEMMQPLDIVEVELC